MADDAQLPLGEGAQLRELLRRIRDERVLVYSEGPDHLSMQNCKIPFDPIREGLRRHKELFIALTTPDESLTENDKRTILEHDIRVGFQPPGDWEGARRELCERGGMYLG